MSVNKYKPHIHVLPEDDANRQIANGFLLAPLLNLRAIQVLPPAGGWHKVLDDVEQTYAAEMSKYPSRYMILLIDFDEQEDRLVMARNRLLPEHKDRVFVLGVWSEPEKLKQQLNSGSYEAIGRSLAEGCPDTGSEIWNNALLRHNRQELNRLLAVLKSTLFSLS